MPKAVCPPFRGHVRRKGYVRVSHGLFRAEEPNLDRWQTFRRELEAILLVLPPGTVFTHLTAARLLGWQLPSLPDQMPTFAAVRNSRHPRRPGLLCARLTHQAPAGTVDGLPVDAAEEILLRCARDIGVLDLVILIDSARRLGHVDTVRMSTLLASKRPGVARLREAWRRSEPRSESAPETLLRLFHEALDIEVEPQVDLHDDEGRFLARADLRVTGTTFVHEYDGAGHREASQHRKDLRRERRLSGTSYVRRGFTLDDLLNHASVVMHELDRALGRPHDLSRLSRWRALVDQSLYAPAGRARLVNRWKRQMGLVEWSQSA